ncbi:MAG: hypothetical protein NXH72_12310 [Hyphomonadaceae bacterium]|nr:hypothetical protein [Hyphomonadaceae bacterium]
MMNTLPRTRRSVVSGDDANIVAAAALILPVLLIAAGASIDLRRANNVAADLQVSLDAAALAAVADDSVTGENAAAFVTTFVSRNLDPKCVTSVTATKLDRTVTVNGSCTLPTTFLGYINKPTLTVNQAATAQQRRPEDTPCVLALSDRDQTAIRVNAGASINAPSCGIHSNATGLSAVFVNNDGSIEARSVCMSGEARVNNNGTINPSPQGYCDYVADPLASLPIPDNAEAPCQHLNFDASYDQEISPGVYCGTITVTSGTTITMQPGTYVFREGAIILNGGSSLIGTDTTLYFHDDQSRIRANSQINIQLDAPDTGPYAGIAVFQNQNVSAGTGPSFQINSDSNSFIEGVYYTPGSELTINADAGFNQSAAYSAIMVDRLTLNAGATLNLNSDFETATPLPELLQETPPQLIF